MAKAAKEKTITDLIPDDRNINRGTEDGAELLEKSIDEVGFGRSIVVDKDYKTMAGNKIVAAAIRKGKQKIKIVDVTGDELVVVRRTDISINSEKGAKLKILDNTTHKKNYVEDAVVRDAIVEEFHFNSSQLGLDRAQQSPAGRNIYQVQTEPFEKNHILLSFSLDKLVALQPLLEKIKKIEGVEMEQSSN